MNQKIEMFQYIVRVMRGQIHHWVEHHNPVVTELWQHALSLGEGRRALFKELIVVSSGVVEALVGMNHGNQLPFAVDCRTIDTNGYHQLYSIVMAYFVFQLTLLNPQIQKELLDSLLSVCGETEEQGRFLARFARVQALLPKQRQRSPDLMNLGSEVWQALQSVLKVRNEPLDGSQFTVFAASVFNAGLRKLQTSMEEKANTPNC